MMIRILVTMTALGALTACGGSKPTRTVYAAPGTTLFATGPIYAACLKDGRAASNQSLCGCVQGVANQSLSPVYQERGASYFNDPARLQEVRQSDNAGNERFWKAWKAYGKRAAQVCSG